VVIAAFKLPPGYGFELVKLRDDFLEQLFDGRPSPTPVALKINRINSPLKVHGVNIGFDLLREF
jgi:hypothetical protein